MNLRPSCFSRVFNRFNVVRQAITPSPSAHRYRATCYKTTKAEATLLEKGIKMLIAKGVYSSESPDAQIFYWGMLRSSPSKAAALVIGLCT